MESKRSCLIVLYSHPEGYPPTLNAIDILAQQFETVTLIYQNRRTDSWQYPPNSKLIKVGSYTDFRTAESKGIFWKLKELFLFVKTLKKEIAISKPNLILAYDSFALMCCAWLGIKKRNIQLWYHNHDVLLPNHLFSLSSLARKYEKSYLPKVDIVSLPAIERKKYFPIDEKRQYFFLIPNYPMLKNFPPSLIQNKGMNTIKLLFMGAIGANHGFEEILRYIHAQKQIHHFTLILKGVCKETYQKELLDLAKKYDIENQLIFIGYGPYQEVPLLAASCHIGIGIHAGNSVMEQSLGKSSNKLYEYAAAGLPVLLFDNRHFREHFNNYGWVQFTDLSFNGLHIAITTILMNYEAYSKQARLAFEQNLNFEHVFLPVLKNNFTYLQ